MKKFIALLMAGVMLLSFAACGGNKEEETTATTVPETTIGAAEQDELNDLLGGNDETEVATEIVTEIVTNEEGETEVVTEIVTEKPTKNNNEKVTDKKEDVDVSKWSTAEVLKYYKAVTNNVETKKPGYTKERSAALNGKYEAGVALQAFKDVVFQFLGIGEENKFTAVVPKGKTTTDDKCGSFLKTSGLTEADVKSAKAVKSGSNYIITIELKDGSSSIEGGANSKNNSPIDKSGICAPGNADRSGFDHKSAQVTYAALKDFAAGLVMKEQTKNGKIVATVNASNGELTNLVISWDASAELTKVMGSNAKLSAKTTVKYSKFGW